MADRYSIFPASLGAAATLNLQQVHGVSLKSGTKKDLVIPGGAIDPAAVMLLGAEPIVSFKTSDIATVLTAVSPTAGLNCATANSLIQFQKRLSGGAFAGTLSHVVITSKLGFLIPKKLTVSQDKPADLELEFHALFDGTTAGVPAQPVPPLTISVSQTLTSSPAFNGRFYQGPVYANAAQMLGIESFEVDFGIEVERGPTDGDLWSRVISIKSRKPVLTAKCKDAAAANTVSSFFNAALPGALAFYLRAGAAGAARVSDATAGHVKITAATGAWHTDDMDAQDDGDAETSIHADVTGTLAVSTAATIP